jgi:competence ComEA-like helix-hairpin-helix protein
VRQPASVTAQVALRDGRPLELNAASAHDLELLPGIGPSLAQRIVEARSRKRFGSVEELSAVRGIGARTLERLRPFVRVETQGSSIQTAESTTAQ